MSTITILFFQVIALFISVYAYKRESVSISGFISMILISSIFIWNNGLLYLIVLFSMFLSSSLISKYKKEFKTKLTEKVLKKHGPRDMVQAFSNLGVAFICFLIYVFTKNEVYIIALYCSVATSNADSWASEIGVLSTSKPVLITNFKKCKPGISGGITLLGTFSGVLGSIFIALIAVIIHDISDLNINKTQLFLLISLSGIFGFILDSILGATIQIVYINEQNEETENLAFGKIKSRGIQLVNNDMINFISSVFVAILIVVSYNFIGS